MASLMTFKPTQQFPFGWDRNKSLTFVQMWDIVARVHGNHNPAFPPSLLIGIFWEETLFTNRRQQGGPAVGFVTGDINSDRVIFTDGSSASFGNRKTSGTSMVYGGYVNATFVYHATEGGDFYLGAQFMPMSNANFTGNGRTARLNLSGQVYVTFGINWPF